MSSKLHTALMWLTSYIDFYEVLLTSEKQTIDFLFIACYTINELEQKKRRIKKKLNPRKTNK
jgi:hypothetical protein